jgi:signal transduction histidine kinase
VAVTALAGAAVTATATSHGARLRVALGRWGVPFGSLLVAVVAVASELAAAPHPVPPAVGAYAAALLTSAALLARTRWPIAVAVAILVVCLGYHLVGYPGQGPAFALFVATFAIPWRGRVAWTLPVGIAVAGIWSIIPALPPHPSAWTDGAVLGPAIGMATVAVIGAMVRVSLGETAAEHTAQLAEARAGIARDIHDVLAHTLAAITVQANLAVDAVDDDPATAKAAMLRARDLARAATPQLRHSLLRLRDDGRPQPPQPTLELVGRVLDDARAAGFVVGERVDVEPGRLDPLAELTVARIVQESVTNAVRHSGGTRLDCTIAVHDRELVVEVADDGSRAPGPEGLGIAGMRERASAIGGTLEAAAVPGGFRVRATIPIPADRTRA